MSLIFLDNIVKEYRSRLVLNGASLRVERKERLALTGPNGSGKTTLIRIAMGFETCDSGNVVTGRGVKIGYLTQDLSEMGGFMAVPGETAVHYEKVARLERKLRELEIKIDEVAGKSDEPSYTGMLGEYSRLLERYEALDGYTIEARIKATLYGLGLKEEALSTPVGNLSGGEQMRVAIARLLLEEPDLLILDEPTNHLDIRATEWLEGFLKKFEGGVLFVSHDRYFLDQVATRVAELENGSIVERSGSYASFIEQKKKMAEFAESEKRKLEINIQIEEKKALSLKGEGKHRQRNISAWKSREKMVARLKDKLDHNNNGFRNQEHLYGKAAPRIQFRSLSHLSAEIARADGLCKEFAAGTSAVGNAKELVSPDRNSGGTILSENTIRTVLFSDVSFLIRGGERVGIIGPNGCGKSTLLNILLGRDMDYKGFARLGNWVKYAFLGQRIEFANENWTIMEEFMSKKEMDEAYAREKLSGFQFYGDDVNKKIGVLSGGERVRLHLACIMLLEPDCLVMDEPTNHLDVTARDAVMEAIANFKGSLLAVSHDRYFLNKCVNRILEFEDGRLMSYQGNYEAYRLAKGMDAGDAANAGNAGKTSLSGRGEVRCDNRLPVNNPWKERKGAGVPNASSIHGANAAGNVPGTNRLALEGKIFVLEEMKNDLEQSFGRESSPEEYKQYNDLILQLNSLYEAWDRCPE